MASTAPIWPFPPSWGEGAFIETFSFLTSVMTDNMTGTEQRQALRATPRKMFESTFTVLDNERTQLDLMLQAVGASRWRVPLWHYAVLAIGLETGDFSIDYDFRGRGITEGTELLIYGAGPNDYEVVTVGSLDDDGRAQLAANIVNSWPSATVVPLREGQLTDQPTPQRASSCSMTLQARFLLAGANPWVPSAPSLIYQGLPVLLGLTEDQSDGVRTGYQRMSYMLDGQTGGTYRVDTAGRAVNMQGHTLSLQGPYAYGRLLDLIYTLRGQLGLLWLPTFADDFKLTKPAALGAQTLVVGNVGYSTYGVDNPDRSHIFIELNSGDRYCFAITGAAVGGAPDSETLSIDTPLPVAIDPIDIYAFCFLTKMRSSADDIEVTSMAGIEGVSACELSFQSETDTRVAAVGGMQSKAPVLLDDFEHTVLGGQPYSSRMNILYGDGRFTLANVNGLMSGSLPAGVTLQLDNLGNLLLSGVATSYGDFTFVPAIDTHDGQRAIGPEQHIHVTTPIFRNYWRLFITSREVAAQLSMVRSVIFQPYPDGPSLTEGLDEMTLAISSPYYQTSTPDKAFRLDYPLNLGQGINPHLPPTEEPDVVLGELADSWAANTPTAWVGFHFPTAVDINAMELWVGNPDTYPGNGPTELHLQYSSDGATWTDKKIWTGLNGWDSYPWRKLNVL